ncbi:S-layer family protein [Anaerobacterium chartisolvens]|uniref:S-layer family protein n=1 Tax=Anaerobacterium chartisolvens TaxID=1297424 RepID=A0A369ASP2_9FIRM|nr:S-layer homology domain-containing protein [Anaerobacterium chartisolvens]RCX11237.1 S-layer family protein [Anaerobacterium chartisolvens]
MRIFKKLLALVLIINITYGMCPNLAQLAHGAGTAALIVSGYENKRLTIRWNTANVRSVQLKYHKPAAGDTAQYVDVAVSASGASQTMSSVTIDEIESDYIYDIAVSMYDAAGGESGTGILIATGSVNCLPKISFNAEIVHQQPVENTGGGSESGIMPSLKVSWNIPKVYDGSAGYIPMDSVTSFQMLNSGIESFNYKVTVADSSNRADVDIAWQSGGGYTARVAGDSSRTSGVKRDGNSYYFYLLGIKEDGAVLPTTAQVAANSYGNPSDGELDKVLPDAISGIGDNNFVLPHKDIRPGTVYYMRLNTLPLNASGTYINCLSSGPLGNLATMGELSYVYTPIRFALTKDSLDNVNVKIYRINKGNLNMPQLYYEVQLCSFPSDQDSDWNQGAFRDKGKVMDGTYFTGPYQYTLIEGISPENEVFYRVVVKSNATSDRLESLKTPYTIRNDISRPPIPRNVLAVAKADVVNKTSDVTISWDKPSQWDQIKTITDPDQDIVFHFILNINQNDLDSSVTYPLEAGGETYGSFNVKYRLMGYVNARAGSIIDRGSRLEFTMKGADLFKGIQWDDTEQDFNPNETDADGNVYPDFLLTNKTYYLQVYTTKGENRGHYDAKNTQGYMSDRSVTTSFTTVAAAQKDVPLPGNFKTASQPTEDTIVLQFDKVNINWDDYSFNHTANDRVYYDLYMSTRTAPESFVMIGTTQRMNTPSDDERSDIAFQNVDNTQLSYIRAGISSFRAGVGYTDPASGVYIDPYDIFGEGLKSNTTYYFKVKTRLFIEHPLYPLNPAVSTSILSVTTDRDEMQDPDDAADRPIAPADFDIALDGEGNFMLTGQSVTFTWAKRENAVRYSLVCTSKEVGRREDVSLLYDSDGIYKSFIDYFGNLDKNIDGDSRSFTLDPALNLTENQNPKIDAYTFAYNGVTETYTLSINKWLFPNKLYYFSLRAEIWDGAVNQKQSVWISIPVTTTQVEAPTFLEPVNDAQLGFWWRGELSKQAEEYKIYLKKSEDSEYTLLTRTQYTAIKDGSIFYGRIPKLKTDTLYDIKVCIGTQDTLIRQLSLKTRDAYHELEVKWRGIPLDDYTGFEIAIKTPEAGEYTVLEPSDLEVFQNVNLKTPGNNNLVPARQYAEKTVQTLGTDYYMYYARIKTVTVKYADGTVVKEPLKSNMKYYIKVRTVKNDPLNDSLPEESQRPSAYSKYAGPVDSRTEFSQDDYDDEDDDTNKEATYLDRVSKLEEALYWRVEMSSTKATKILLKGDRVSNVIEGSPDTPCVIDISTLKPAISVDVIYVPLIVANVLNAQNGSLVVKTVEAEYTINPGTLDVENMAEIKAVEKKSGVKEVFFKLTVTRGDYPASTLPQGATLASKVNDLEVQVLGSSKTDEALKKEFYDKMYNDKTGIVKQKRDMLSNPYFDNTQTKQKLNAFMDQLIKETESELSDYIGRTVEGTNGSGGMVVAKEYMTSFGNAMRVKLVYTVKKGINTPYVNYDGVDRWQKLTKNISRPASNALVLSAERTGKYGVFAVITAASDLPVNYWAKESIDKFLSKYDLRGVFAGVDKSFNPEMNVSVEEMVLLYEKVMAKTEANAGADIKQKVSKMGLNGIVNTAGLKKDITRQEASAIFIKVYCSNKGLNSQNLRPSKNIFVSDEDDIGSKYYSSVMMTIDLKVMSTDETGSFKPKSSITRAQAIDSMVKVMGL